MARGRGNAAPFTGSLVTSQTKISDDKGNVAGSARSQLSGLCDGNRNRIPRWDIWFCVISEKTRKRVLELLRVERSEQARARGVSRSGIYKRLDQTCHGKCNICFDKTQQIF